MVGNSWDRFEQKIQHTVIFIILARFVALCSHLSTHSNLALVWNPWIICKGMQWYDVTWGQFIIKPQQKLASILQGFKGHTYDGRKN